MKRVLHTLIAAAAMAVVASPGFAQDKPTITKYLNDGYAIIRSDIGGQFLQFIMRKDNNLVWCSALIQTGQTVSCRTIK